MKRPDGSLRFREAVLFPQELADQLLAKMATEGTPAPLGTLTNRQISEQVKTFWSFTVKSPVELSNT